MLDENSQLKKTLDEVNELNRRLQKKLVQSPAKERRNSVRFEPLKNATEPMFTLNNPMIPTKKGVMKVLLLDWWSNKI